MAPNKGTKLPAGVAKKKADKVMNPLFEKRLKQFGIGGALPSKKDLHRFVKWPQVVRIQRKKMILKQRLKVPPPIHQFSKTLDKNLATSLFKMLLKYRPEDRVQKKERLLKRAQVEAEGKTPEACGVSTGEQIFEIFGVYVEPSLMGYGSCGYNGNCPCKWRILQGKPSDWQDFVGIITLLVINSTISFIEENKAGNAAAALMARLAPKAKVMEAAAIMAIALANGGGKPSD